MAAKTKSRGWRKMLKWTALLALIGFLIVWYDHGIGPSSDTIALRRQLAGTTNIKIFWV